MAESRGTLHSIEKNNVYPPVFSPLENLTLPSPPTSSSVEPASIHTSRDTETDTAVKRIKLSY